MVKKNKIITICSSVSYYKQVVEIEGMLRKLGFKVKIPKTASIMKKTDNFDINAFRSTYRNRIDYLKKTEFIKQHFKKIVAGNAILVTNFDKNGFKGYIGGNVLMEMALAFYHKKPIFIYNDISDDLPIKDEVYGLNPIFIHGDLSKIHQNLL